MTPGTVPTFLVIGAARSGTTGLVEGLRTHPQVFVTDPKEPHYFALHRIGARFTAPGDDHTINRVAVTDRDPARAAQIANAVAENHPEIKCSSQLVDSFCLLVLRTVQSGDADAPGFVPVISVTVAIAVRFFQEDTRSRGLEELRRQAQGLAELYAFQAATSSGSRSVGP